MTKTKTFIVGVVILMGSMFMTACSTEDSHDLDIDSGVVIKRTHKRVTVLEDDGEKDSHRLRGKKCQVGSRWPDCKR